MAARAELPPDAALERIRRLARERQQRRRARLKEDGHVTSRDGHVTPAAAPAALGPAAEARHVTPSQTLPVLSSSKELEKVRAILEPFAGRGYAHSPRFWQLAAEQYPHLCLELEALKVSDWLDEPRNAKRKCNKAFLSNWLSKADVDRQQRDVQARQLPPVGSGSGSASRPAPGRPPDPKPVLPDGAVLQMIDPAEARRALLDAKRLTLPEKLALVRNGRQR